MRAAVMKETHVGRTKFVRGNYMSRYEMEETPK